MALMFNWCAIPFVRLLIPLIIGITLSTYLHTVLPYGNWIFLFLLFLLILLHSRKISFQIQWMPGLLLNIALLVLGYQLVFYHNDLNRENHFQHYLSDENIFYGKIASAPTDGNWLRVKLELMQIGSDGQDIRPCDGKVMAFLEGDSLSSMLKSGMMIIGRSAIQDIPGPSNPHTFDYRDYLSRQNIHYQTFIRSGDWQSIPIEADFTIMGWAHQSREVFLKILRTYLPTPNEQAVGQALILGYQDAIDTELRNAYANTGAMHVLAVSGLHVGLVYIGLAFLLSLLPFNNKMWTVLKVILLLTGVWFFALLTGASASVLRAATMFSFLIIGTNLRRQPNIYNVLAASAFCLLCLHPYLLQEVGFQLSYLAVIGIVYFQPKVYRLWIIDNKLGDYLWKLVAVGIAAQLTTLPLSLYYFHQFPLSFWLSGIVVVPAATLILGGGMLLLFTATLLPLLAAAVGYGLFGIIWLMNALIFLIQQIPGQLISGIWISMLTVFILYFIIFCVAMIIESQKVKWLLASLSAVLALGIAYNLTSIRSIHQRQFTLYQLKGHSLIDFVDGKRVYSFKNTTLPQDLELKTAKPHRQAIGAREVKNVPLDQAPFATQSVNFDKGIVQFYTNRMAVLDADLPVIKGEPIAVAQLLIRNDFKTTLPQLFSTYQPDLIIVDGSNSGRTRYYWKKVCLENNIPFFDLIQEGAFTKEL